MGPNYHIWLEHYHEQLEVRDFNNIYCGNR